MKTFLAVITIGCAAFGAVVAPAHADLEEEEVLLLWNSVRPTGAHGSDMEQIKDKYLLEHPNVHVLDLAYSWTPSFFSCPNGSETSEDCIQWQYTSVEAYIKHIAEPVRAEIERIKLEEGDDILCIVTMRGLPVLITDCTTQACIGEFSGHYTGGRLTMSLEGALARPYEVPTQDLFTNSPNPYHAALGTPFRDFIERYPCVEGELFMVSRLDSGIPDLDRDNVANDPDDNFNGDTDAMGNDVVDRTDGILAMLDRSQDIDVNKYLVTAVCDVLPCSTGAGIQSLSGARTLRDNGWYVFANPQTMEFLDGEFDTSPCVSFAPDIEGRYYGYKEIVHFGYGMNAFVLCSATGCCGGGIQCNDQYVEYFDAHAAGIFGSGESYNGITLRGGQSGNQGDGLDWISEAGGSFAALHSFGPHSGDPLGSGFSSANFFVHGMSWAESVHSSINKLAFIHCPIGDPLATVNVIDPDIDGDGEIEPSELIDILTIFSFDPPLPCPNPCNEDVNHDGVVNMEDFNHAVAAYNAQQDRPILDNVTNPIRNQYGALVSPLTEGDFSPCHLQPSAPVSISGTICRGDVNGDLVIDSKDLDLFDELNAEEWSDCECIYEEIDVNGDGFTNTVDRNIILSAQGTVMYDLNGNGELDCTDLMDGYLAFCDATCSPQMLELFDANCDGVLSTSGNALQDLQPLINHFLPVSQMNYDGDDPFLLDCTDLQILHTVYNASSPPHHPKYDLNSDGVVDCKDEGILHAIMFVYFNEGLTEIADSDSCGTLGCSPGCW